MARSYFLLPASLLVSLIASCSSSSPSATSPTGTKTADAGGSCPLYVVPANTDTTTATSLQTDVMPIFAQNCATSIACHNATGAGMRVFLGGNAASIHSSIVGVASVQLASMPYVTAGDPEKSYLLHKMDGDQCYFDKSCITGFCQGSMPSSAPILDAPVRDTIRRWIAEGAKNN